MKFFNRILKQWRALTRTERLLATTAVCLVVGIAAVACCANNGKDNGLTENPPAAAAVLMDASDPITGGNAEEVIAEIEKIGAGLPLYGDLTVYDIHNNSKTIVSLRRPRRGTECNSLTENCVRIERIYQREFVEKLRARLSDFLSGQGCKDTSPIIEALRRLSRLSEYKHKRIPDGSKSLYVVSDMLQHTPGAYSHYGRPKCTIGPNEFARLQKTPFYRKFQADLSGWNVAVFYILRNGLQEVGCDPQDENHKRFWRNYFEASNVVRSVEITEVNYFGSGAQCQARP